MQWFGFGMALALALALPAAEASLFNAEGYRIASYRAPIAQAPPGTHRIAPAAAASLRPDDDAVFIDVMPAQGGRRDPRTGVWTLAEQRLSIPGAHWFPEAGRGEPEPDIARWFDRGVVRLTKGRRDRMIVIFCLADCWMSWNAARRLASHGYSKIWWLAEGTDGWSDLGLTLVPLRPEPGAISAS
ncbi:rhodanese-like domain-containing protein [Sphingopyxis sp.]|jgi:PQQ-dependent catabolism-associated CXXCW motif protein|uniref:rhodanese-like domain-containing protein n=1 Tax=Sphingomonadales TaxID=204457 RepID=UPI003F727B13